MKFSSFVQVLLLFSLISYGLSAQQTSSNINIGGMTVSSRVDVPAGYFRPPFPSSSFQNYLQSINIKDADAKVMKYDGYEKKFICYSAVMNLELLEQDLMHGEHYIQSLRAQFLYNHSKYDMIKFNYDDGRNLSYKEWTEGMRFVWQDSIYVLDSIAAPNNSDIAFRKYMNEIYENSSTLGLNNDSEVLSMSDLSIGDALIQPQDQHSPGHAVLILDMAVHPETGEKLVLLGQGYAPAQDMHILFNPYDQSISPWYRINEDDIYFATAQWTFRQKHIRRFKINANANSFTSSSTDLADE